MKKLKTAMTAILMLAIVAMAFAFGENASEAVSMAGITPVAATLKNELAEKELIKKFRHDNTWLNEVRSKNNWVGNDAIKIPKQGAAPNVLINNNVYPINKNDRDDSHVVVSLNKYDTENTTVTDDELYALPYEKVSDVQTQHREELEDTTAEHALHAIAPASNSTNTPVLVTTGEDDGTGRKRLTSKDLINLKKKMDNLKVPKQGRILVLCPDHVADLLEEDRKFYSQYQNHKAGVISMNYYGFKTYESTYCPTYDAGGDKEAFGAAPTGYEASVVLHKRTVVKATGTVKRYMRDASDDPEMRENTIGFRLWFVCVPIKDEGSAAIVSASVA